MTFSERFVFELIINVLIVFNINFSIRKIFDLAYKKSKFFNDEAENDEKERKKKCFEI